MNITFCINTAVNERNHIELLFRSLRRNLSHKNHEILVYVENDNQDTTGFLLSQKAYFPDLKIIKNPLPIPLGYARNINLMFERAKYDVVSYLQSDMVICSNYDIEVIKHLREDNIISSTRVEPPLHPPSPEKITPSPSEDFGLDPVTFDLDRFTHFAEVKKDDRVTNFWFAPFTLYKKHWLDIGGHDTLFRRSREDSDLLYRFTMKGLKIEQAWNAIVYHFTCTSSRGIEWWTEKAQGRTHLQAKADAVEFGRFLRKWGRFKHTTNFDPTTEYKFSVSANFINVPSTHVDLIVSLYSSLNKIYIDNQEVRNILRDRYNRIHAVANDLLSIKLEDWDIYKKYYRLWNTDDVFPTCTIESNGDDSVLTVDMANSSIYTVFRTQMKRQLSWLPKNSLAAITIDDVIETRNQTRLQDFCEKLQPTLKYYEGQEGECDFDGIKLVINQATNRIQDNLVVKNPPIDDINFTIL